MLSYEDFLYYPKLNKETAENIAQGIFFHRPGNVDYMTFKNNPLFGLDGRGTLEIGTVFDGEINLVIFIPPLFQKILLETPRPSIYESMPRLRNSKALKLKPPVRFLPQIRSYLDEISWEYVKESDTIGMSKLEAAVRYLPNQFIVAAIDAQEVHYEEWSCPEQIELLPFKHTSLTADILLQAINVNVNKIGSNVIR